MITITPIASSSSGNCYHVTDGNTPLLLEAGLKWKEARKRLNFKTSEIEACLVSHYHGDHSLATRDVIRAGIDVYATYETFDALGISGHRVKPIIPKESFQVGTWNIMPFETVHDADGSIGFLLVNNSNEKLLFLTDTAYSPYMFTGLTHIMIEANFSSKILRKNVQMGFLDRDQARRLVNTHLSIERVIDLLCVNDISRVREIHLMHLSSRNSDGNLFKKMVQAATGKPVYVAEV